MMRYTNNQSVFFTMHLLEEQYVPLINVNDNVDMIEMKLLHG